MRILHILDHSIPLHSGYTFRTAAILREQAALGWQTFQLTSTKQGPSKAPFEHVQGLDFFRTMPLDETAPKIPVWAELDMMKRLRLRMEEVVDQVKPDLIHAHSPVLNVMPALSVGQRRGIPVVYEIRAFWEDAAVDHGTTRENGVKYRVSRALETRGMRRVDHLFTICEGLRRDILGRGIAADKVTVIPNAVDIEAFQFATPRDLALQQKWDLNGKTVLGFVGSFYAYEGLDLLLKAVPELARQLPELRVLLVGGGPQEQALRQQAIELGIADRVVFAGRVPHQEVDAYYGLIDLLVYPRHSMRLTELVTPLKPLEAMAQGHLFIASDVGGHQELIPGFGIDVMFQAGQVDALVKCAVNVLKHQEAWPEMRAKGREFVERERNWRKSVSHYQPVYERLVRSSS